MPLTFGLSLWVPGPRPMDENHPQIAVILPNFALWCTIRQLCVLAGLEMPNLPLEPATPDPILLVLVGWVIKKVGYWIPQGKRESTRRPAALKATKPTGFVSCVLDCLRQQLRLPLGRENPAQRTKHVTWTPELAIHQLTCTRL